MLVAPTQLNDGMIPSGYHSYRAWPNGQGTSLLRRRLQVRILLRGLIAYFDAIMIHSETESVTPHRKQPSGCASTALLIVGTSIGLLILLMAVLTAKNGGQ